MKKLAHYTSAYKCSSTFTYSTDSYASFPHTHTHTHTAWTSACDYDKPCCLPRSSPRLLKRMGRNAKETRRSQAYSSTVGVEAWSAGAGGRMLLTIPHSALSLFPHPLSLQRPHVCQPSSGASLLSILPISLFLLLSLPLVPLFLFSLMCFSYFLFYPY